MMLVLQIAAGIVLGFAIIAYRHSLIHAAKILGVVAAVVIAALGIGFLIALGVEAGQPWLARVLIKLGMVIVIGMVLLCVVLGAVGLGMLGYAANLRINIENSHYGVLIAANVAFVGFVFWLASYVPPLANLYNSIDAWSRDNGYKDAGSVLVLAVAQLWPWVAYYLMQFVKRKPAVTDEA